MLLHDSTLGVVRWPNIEKCSFPIKDVTKCDKKVVCLKARRQKAKVDLTGESQGMSKQTDQLKQYSMRKNVCLFVIPEDIEDDMVIKFISVDKEFMKIDVNESDIGIELVNEWSLSSLPATRPNGK